MDKVYAIVQLVATVLSFLVVVVLPVTIWLVKKVKELITTPAEKMPDKIVDIWNSLIDYIKSAESAFTSGTAKLDDVLKSVKLDCLSAGITFDKDYWTKAVNKVISMTKKVNANG